MRNWLIALIGLVPGLLVGVLVTQSVFSERLDKEQSFSENLRGEKVDLQAKLASLEDLHNSLRAAHDDSNLKLSRLENELANLMLLSKEAQLAESDVEAESEPIVEADAAEPDEEQNRRRGRGDWNSPEMMERMQQRFADSVNERWENTDDPGRKERIALFAEHQQYLMELGQSIRATEDEAGREAIMDDMRAARNDFQRVVREEQKKLMKDLGKQFGVKDDKQNEFTSTMQYILSDPAFSGGGFGGGPGGNRFGRGGGGRGSGGRGGQR